MISVAPPGRDHSKHILHHGAKPATISVDMLERALFPKVVRGAQAILRPYEYDPPSGWVPPDQRPKA
jgi:hypothetical protein